MRPVVPFNDRKLNMEAQLLGFMAERDIPFNHSDDLIQLSQNMAKDIKVLNAMSMDRTTASYKLSFGLAKYFQDKLDKDLQKTFFSLNIDESTSNSNEKIVAVLVSYFSTDEKQVVVKHLESFSIVTADSATLFNKVCEMFQKHNLPWKNLISVLLDSCNTMRGKKSGLETRMREKASHLLDIDGDAVHHAHNAAKAFASPFQYFLEGLFKDIHADFLWSDDLRKVLEKICEIVGVKYTMPERFLGHRFLSAHKLSIDTQRLFEAFTIFYFSFIKERKEVERYKYIYQELIKRKDLSEKSQQELLKLKANLASKKMTKEGAERKERIIHKLFYERKTTRILLSLYASVLEVLKEYTVMFQAKEPMVHVLHDEQTRLVREFLGYFVRPEVLPQGSRKVTSLPLEKEALWLPVTDMFIGSTARKLMLKLNSKDPLRKDISERIQNAFVKCGKVLQQKMPINNELLKSLSAIDPCARGHGLTVRYLLKLPGLVTNVLTEEEESAYEKEVHQFNIDPTIPEFDSKIRIDHWWACLEEYPYLRKLALATLTCFHGPMVEGCFNLMGDVMDAKSSRLGVNSLDSLQTVKSHLASQGSLKYFDRENHLYDPIKPGLVHCMISASKENKRAQRLKRDEKEERMQKLDIKRQKVATKRAAAEMASKAVKKAKLDHMQRCKQMNKS